MEFVVNVGKVTKLDMNYPDWSPDMIELFGQKVDICEFYYHMSLKPNKNDDISDRSLCHVKLENGNRYIVPKDWLTVIKVERKPTSYKHKLVCVSANKSNYFTAGKVYLFDKGVLFDNSDVAWNEALFDDCALTYAQNVEDINKYFEDDMADYSIKFIEYVE